ncbi:hypothetical protein BK139_23105 [Paenibacillus sp. FSL R5-0490]|uniref:hypothetical protein n=1 Tax=Bacillales TaxID=1385 RepID=UPI00096E71BB|nr:hypothetical protein [Paenibacillus sp. FSL R5-0490]OMF51770.1 hypothetical protein BK139_23105 [Paenibacillus sp. FSL R5-0490]
MDLPLENIHTINFKRKKVPLSPELRPLYKISLIILILYLSSNKQTASLLKLQLFNWALKNPKRFNRLDDIKKGGDFPIIRFDPSLNRALNFAVAEQQLEFNEKNGKFILTNKGVKFAESIMEHNDVLVEEKDLLEGIKKGISDAYVMKVFKERYKA